MRRVLLGTTKRRARFLFRTARQTEYVCGVTAKETMLHISAGVFKERPCVQQIMRWYSRSAEAHQSQCGAGRL